jgi:hypothetical protein
MTAVWTFKTRSTFSCDIAVQYLAASESYFDRPVRRLVPVARSRMRRCTWLSSSERRLSRRSLSALPVRFRAIV